VKNNREGADVVSELRGGENASVMAKGIMGGGVEIRKSV
jgi:hypothetical protein